jgi:hypothetical protein
MMDAVVQSLLEQAIDTPCKLHLLLIFHENPRLDSTPRQVAERSCRDIWSVTQALQELAEDGVLSAHVAAGDLRYRYTPRPEQIEAIRKLVRGYDDPLERDRIQSSVREIASYAQFQRGSAWQPQPRAI